MLDLVSFLIQICRQGQHLDINKISIPFPIKDVRLFQYIITNFR
jgi:hypothetical protein